ncbi:neuropeptide Y receptor type 5-like [Haliotis rubra]|uniref:neuropeptide Y receptor type 5-like n=1 Tax=Haliotis rubra TaxID=36100 RepID=UPI001EE5B554|nr:neuropeptide Y receptor type 5-like [Haliotis rubra]
MMAAGNKSSGDRIALLPADLYAYFDMSDLDQSGNYSLEDFMKVATEYKESDRWFDGLTELCLTLSFSLLMLIGISGNITVGLVILRRRSSQSTRNWYIFNLAVSDILTCIFCKPFLILRMILKNWDIGVFMCKLVPTLQTTYVLVSTLTILALAVDRYKAILYTSGKDRNVKITRYIIPTIWAVSLFVALPIFLTHEVEHVIGFNGVPLYSICREKWNSYVLLTIYTIFVLLIQYLSPMVSIITLHVKICQFLGVRIHTRGAQMRDMHNIRRKLSRHRKNILLLTSMAVSFVVSWLPLTLVNIIADIDYRTFEHTDFPLIHAVCVLVAFTSVCVNPVIYGWFNSNFKRDLRRLCNLNPSYKCSKYVLIFRRSSRNPDISLLISTLPRDVTASPRAEEAHDTAL